MDDNTPIISGVPAAARTVDANGRHEARTGADQEWTAEDLAAAEGHDPTPKNIRRAQLELDRLGPAAIEKTVP
ncbi:hypothetical protein [Dactylosporangium darangshiense]|jgi:hypothetical protein|uniref:DUF3072 domain-containing protein n=1 Tax=Dactylosporangium darangshiense TaxID=579108 RepID=A0ABP8DKD3_9ACTN|nr:hypothetical protein [Dactylosporangium sp.]